MKNYVRSVLFLGTIIVLLAALAVPAFAIEQRELLKLQTRSSFGDQFGWSVAISEDTAVVGAVGDDNIGSAEVHVREPNGAWTWQSKLTPADGSIADNFGFSVAVDGETAVIGARGDDDSGSFSGSAYVFTRDVNGNWSQQAKLLASDGSAFDQFGVSVAISGDTLVVGAPFDDDLSPESGSVYVFTRDVNGAWAQEAKLTTIDAQAFGKNLGISVALDGNTMVAGARRDDGFRGSAYVFNRDSNGIWNQHAKLTADDGMINDVFGGSVALDGSTLVVGAWGKESVKGTAYVFANDGSGTWTQQARLNTSDGATLDQVGWSVAIGGNKVVIGARGDDYRGRSTGSAYFFYLDSNGQWVEQAKLIASDAATADFFGGSVAVSGDNALIGASGNDDRGTSSGSAYIFSLITDKEGPITSNVTLIPNPVALNAPLNLTANIDDSTTGGSAIDSAMYEITNQGSPILSGAMGALDGTFNGQSESVIAHLAGFSEAAVLETCVSGTDSAGNTGTPACTFIPVFDPEGGFVTGGGWIYSPAGALIADPELTGKANFGFVSKYKKGQQTPSGNTQFQFKAGDLNFHSNTYEWLVVAGHRAQFKGTGSINNSGNYGFMLTAIDADLTPSTDTDLFRIKIWDKDNADTVVYDNELGADLDADPTSAVGGGSIVIRKN